MCTAIGVASGWWSVAGLFLEFIGFAVLLLITIRDVFGKFVEMVLAMKGFEISEIKNRRDLETKVKLWINLQRPAVLRLYAGGAVVTLGVILQIVGSWPCASPSS